MTKSELTSPKKIAKLANKFYRKNMAKEAELIGRQIGNVMKPKPKWIPFFIWLWMLGFFIKIQDK